MFHLINEGHFILVLNDLMPGPCSLRFGFSLMLMNEVGCIVGVLFVDLFRLGFRPSWWLYDFLHLDSLDLFGWEGGPPITSFMGEDVGEFGDGLMNFLYENILLL